MDQNENMDAAPLEQEADRPYSRPRHTCAILAIAFMIMLALICASVIYLVVFIAGPLVKAVDDLPADFPKSLVLYQLDQAKIRIQSPDNRKKLAQLASGLPEWLLAPFSPYLTTDLKTQLAARLNDPSRVPAKPSLGDLSQTFGDSRDLMKSVGLEWSNISKNKTDLFEYYKKQLTSEGFTVKEKISDYKIDLSFFRPGIDGAMSIADSFMKDGGSIVKMTVNYLGKN